MADTALLSFEAYAERGEPYFAIYNRGTAGAQPWEISRLFIRSAHTPSLSPSLPPHAPLALDRITGHSRGYDVTWEKADTSSANIPSQVTTKILSDVSGNGDRLRAWWPAHGIASGALAGNPSPACGQRWMGGLNFDLGNVWMGEGMFTGEIQNVVLREGQGLALVGAPRDWSPTRFVLYISAVIRIGTATYYTTEVANAPNSPSEAAFSIVNGAGSGVVVEVAYLDWRSPGNDATTNWASLYPMHAPGFVVKEIQSVSGGEAVSFISPVSSVGVPSYLECRVARLKNPIFASTRMRDFGFGEVDLVQAGGTGVALPAAVHRARGEGSYTMQTGTAMYIQDTSGLGVTPFHTPFGPTAELLIGVNSKRGWNGVRLTGIVLSPGRGISVEPLGTNRYAGILVEAELMRSNRVDGRVQPTYQLGM